MEFRYTAIVLKKKEIGETDRLYTFYTRERGKVQAVGRGVRKPAAKLAGQLETLTQGSIAVEKSRGAGNITGAVAEHQFASIRADERALRSVLETLAMFDRLTEEEEPDLELFDLLERYLTLAERCAEENRKEKIPLLSQGFLFQMYAHLGYRIETKVCVVSGERLVSDGKYFFSPSVGGIFSGAHTHSVPDAIPMSENTVKLVRLFLHHPLTTTTHVSAGEKVYREVSMASNRLYQWICR